MLPGLFQVNWFPLWSCQERILLLLADAQRGRLGPSRAAAEISAAHMMIIITYCCSKRLFSSEHYYPKENEMKGNQKLSNFIGQLEQQKGGRECLRSLRQFLHLNRFSRENLTVNIRIIGKECTVNKKWEFEMFNNKKKSSKWKEFCAV